MQIRLTQGKHAADFLDSFFGRHGKNISNYHREIEPGNESVPAADLLN
jgi:hypothetical protein